MSAFLSPSAILLYNNSPLDDFLGLTPNEVQVLLYQPFSEDAVVQLQEQIEEAVLDRIPLFRIGEALLRIVEREQTIKLSAKGSLPRKVVAELYEMGFLKDPFYDSRWSPAVKENTIDFIHTARIVCELSPLLKKAKGVLSLTKTGKQLLDKNDRYRLFRQFFLTFIEKFAWCFNDGFEDEIVGQFGSSFSLWILQDYGNKSFKADTFALQYLKAFPPLLEGFDHLSDHVALERFLHCYATRTFERFFVWFGLASGGEKTDSLRLIHEEYSPTDIVDRIFRFSER